MSSPSLEHYMQRLSRTLRHEGLVDPASSMRRANT
jgi:hypothetical protein